MNTYKTTVTVQERGRIVVDETPFDRGDVVEVVLLSNEADKSPQPARHTAGSVLASGVAGRWRDRDDIGDSAEYALMLRERSNRRGGCHGEGSEA